MRHVKTVPDKTKVLEEVFTSPFYILVTIVAAIAYYELFRYTILASNKGVFLVTVPIYLVYLLILSAACLMSVSIFAISKSIRARYAGVGGSTFSIITSSVGDLVIGCSCYAPILSSLMYALGFGSIAVSDAIAFLGYYQSWLVVVFIAANLAFIYYQLGRITRIGK